MRTLIVMMAVLFLALAACTPTSNVGSNKVSSDKTADLELVSFDWGRTEYGSRVIEGTVKNNSSKELSYVQITFALLDSDDAQVGSALDNVNNLAAGTTWKFKASVLEDSATTARVASLTGF